MSRKGVIAKRVKTAPDGSYRESAPNRAVRLAEERCSALGQSIRPSEVSAKVQNRRPITTRPGKQARGRPRHNATPRRARPAREPGTSLAAAQLSRTTADIRPSRELATSGRETIGQISSVRPRRPTEIIRPRPFRLGHDPTVRPTVPTDRPNAAVDPKPFLKPNPHNSSPKPAPT
ncbi:unnamed protein product [Microthlaspi erraticum]|uniref:Uncharacterized protein n=1 Tax=Microthlaspi erraticum TaxID=1685480 RepID=A0A6D2HII8_9BRAS|nr:unnamed protein product [Microthlaspi erraticum]